jgi:farnesyl diphosphate synthase
MARVSAEVDAVLENILPAPDGPEGRLYEAMRYAALAPGKRFRSNLVLAGADIFDVPRHSSLLAAAAVELVHTYSLVHDDLPCMDDGETRRGQPATHVRFDEPVR